MVRIVGLHGGDCWIALWRSVGLNGGWGVGLHGGWGVGLYGRVLD